MKSLLFYNGTLKRNSQHLRNNMTEAEAVLWSRIRGKQLKGLQFYRQKVLGDYIVDFHCHKSKLIIEVEGGQHYTDEGAQKDVLRGLFLTQLGLTVLRFNNAEVLTNIEGVLDKIYQHL